MERWDRIDVLDRRIRAVVDHRARLHERLPDVRAFLGPCPPEARKHVRRVRRAVDSLHRRDDAKLAEPGDVLAVDVLRASDAPPKLRAAFLGMAFERFLVNVEHFAIAAIADRVDTDLVPVLNAK